MARDIEGGVIVINTLVTANGNTDYPIALAKDIEVEDSGKRLDTKLEELERAIGDPTYGLTEIDDRQTTNYTTWSSQNLSEKFQELRDTLPSYNEVYLKGETYNKEETQQLLDQITGEKLENYYENAEVDAKISQSANLTLEAAKAYTDQNNLDLTNEIEDLKNKVGAGFCRIAAEYIMSLFQ